MATGDEIAALELLQEWFEDPAHWMKGDIGQRDRKGQVMRTCLIGGAQYVHLGTVYYSGLYWHPDPEAAGKIVTPTTDRLAAVIREQFPERTEGPVFCIPDFNDHPDTRIEDVQLVVDKSLAQAREEEGL